ncbi:MAG: 4-hydroxy-tetrahydrodipicolinate reductase [Candidatus Omnitrophica bacterium]|nr:4-hydroxy-tetrahydrodipicolinate reductase [Candidatus Omnitrophota bacterium]
MIKVGISGASGKMGKRIIALAADLKNLEIVFGLEDEDHPDVNKTIDKVEISADLNSIKTCDCLIDFSAPLATLEYLDYAVKFNKCMVIGTTGLDKVAQNKIKEAAKNIPIILSPNMSVGVNLLFRLLKIAAGTLKDYKVGIQEAHHIHKKDSPSGTAKRIAEIINQQGFNIKIEDIKADRYDEIIGDHKVVFESGVDKLELSHNAKTRDIFAQGALLATEWIASKNAGFYSMEDVLFG